MKSFLPSNAYLFFFVFRPSVFKRIGAFSWPYEMKNYTVLRYIISTSTSSTSKRQMQSYEYFMMYVKINNMFLENSITSDKNLFVTL